MHARLKARLIKIQGHCGRKGAEIQRLAAASGISLDMLHSVALGRRKLSDRLKEALKQAMRK